MDIRITAVHDIRASELVASRRAVRASAVLSGHQQRGCELR